MLIELYGQNFGCFRDEFRLSMLATDVDPNSDRGIIEVKLEGDDEPLRLLRAAAIYGPNGSGKSTVLRAAGILNRLIDETASLKSDEHLAGFEPFALKSMHESPVRLGMKGVIDGRVHEYEIQFESSRFISEKLIHWRKDKPITLLHRSEHEVTGEWTHDQHFALIAKDFRQNALLLSLADNLTPRLAKNTAVRIRRLLQTVEGPGEDSMQFFAGDMVSADRADRDPHFRAWLLSQLKFADLGVADLKTEVQERQHGPDEGSSLRRIQLLHSGSAGQVFPIRYRRESAGTRRLVELAPILYGLTADGPPLALFADELDSSLHPILLRGMIEHFNCEVSPENVHGQLVFAAHETTLMDAEAKNAVLRRDQIYLTEKDSAGAARLTSLAEFRERNNLNLRRRYLQGRYGALPALGTFAE